MKVELRKALGATVLGIALGFGSAAFAQQEEPPDQQQPPAEEVTPEQEQPAPDNGQEQADETRAAIPQYWIANASLYIANAANVAHILIAEQEVSVQEPEILGEQAQLMNTAINRAMENLQTLEQDALTTKPSAVPDIRNILGQLTVAQVQASVIANAASDGQLGPVFEATLRSLQQHLRQAQQAMKSVADKYGAGDLVLPAEAQQRARR